ncbi:MAG: hypothetical protein B6I22_09175 [Desulfobacteraceae bacterium 4572_123]|nr:MAG: hypothetical protein B6I22_09175 [Desulfobacteraceae bacterium 4572_123]
MKVLYFGIYSKGKEYPRNNNLIRGLRLNGVEVIEAHYPLVGTFQQRLRVAQNFPALIVFGIQLLISFLVLSYKFFRAPPIDAIIVGNPGYFHIHLARLLCILTRRRSLLILDLFIPLYDAIVVDRKLFKTESIAARSLHFFEGSGCRVADLCLMDTQHHCNYLSAEYELPPDRIKRVFAGSVIGTKYASPPASINNDFKVLYVGTYIPLHGVDVILGAARILQNKPQIKFDLIGSGQMQSEMRQLAQEWKLTNVNFHAWIPTDQLGDVIRSYDLLLGVFGATPKAARVIPLKIFDICACGMPFITSDTPAIREAFSHNKNAYLIPSNEPAALAQAICHLKAAIDLRSQIAAGSLEMGKDRFAVEKLGQNLIEIIRKKINDRSSWRSH